MIAITYNEEDRNYPSSYWRVECLIGGALKVFETGDVVRDFKDALRYHRSRGLVLMSSTCDHFPFDVDGFKWEIDPELGEVLAVDFPGKELYSLLFKKMCKTYRQIVQKEEIQ